MRIRRSRAWVGSLAVAGLVAAIAAGTVVAVRSAARPHAEDAAPAAAAALPDLSEPDLVTATWMGWDVSVVKPATGLSEEDVASRAAATQAAGNAINMLRGHAIRATSLARVTVHHLGAPVDPSIDDPTEEQLVLKIKDQVLWVVQVADVDIPIMGPVDRKGPATAQGDMLVLVQPGTNKVILIESLAGEPPEPVDPGTPKK